MNRNRLLMTGLISAIVLLQGQVSKAGFFIPGFTGNSQTELGTPPGGTPLFAAPTADGLINFAVYDNTAGGAPTNWIADLGVPITPLTIGLGVSGFESYVYFYQLVNANPAGTVAADSTLHSLQISAGVFSGGGFLPGTVFDSATPGLAGATGPTGPAANPSIGPPTTDLLPGNNSPGFGGGALTAAEFAAIGGTIAPTSLTFISGEGLYSFGFDTRIPSGGYSSVVFLVSDIPPTYLLGRSHDGFYTDGDVPSNTPEPGTFVMTAGALAIALGAAVSRRRNA
jgi:hypothetical protein